MLATLLFSQGTPMILAGDELGRTQSGNNNTYPQDNEINWLRWDIDPAGAELLEFTRRLVALRKTFPILRRGRFFSGEVNEELGCKDVTWLTPDGDEMQQSQWDDGRTRCFGMLLDGRAQPTGIRQRGGDATLLLIVNAHHDVVIFTLPTAPDGRTWKRLIDTNVPRDVTLPTFDVGTPYDVTGRSLLLFVLEAATRTARPLRESTGAMLDVSETPVAERMPRRP